jgi:poly(hydroxyalkanoate) depolymerase family esterase
MTSHKRYRAIAAIALCIALHSHAASLVEVDDFGPNPGFLKMFEYVPSTASTSPALVVALHGCQQSARDFDDETGWRRFADRWGFLVLLPQQQHFNNPSMCFAWFNGDDLWTFGNDQDRGQGSTLSIVSMIRKLQADHGVDPRRIFVTGLSAGGAMTAVMLATYPDVFAGGAIIAGVPYKCASDILEAVYHCGVDANSEGEIRIKNLTPAQWGKRVRDASTYAGPWPRVSIWHGTADKRVDPSNARELVDQWTNVHGVSRTPSVNTVKGFRHEMYKDAHGRVVVERYVIRGMKHGTPIDPGPNDDQCGVRGDYAFAVGICASYYIAKFWGLDRVNP